MSDKSTGSRVSNLSIREAKSRYEWIIQWMNNSIEKLRISFIF
jgi:hypothetical protein